SGGWRVVAVAVATAVGVTAVVAPAHSVTPVRKLTEQRSYLGVITDACALIGRDSAVVVLQDPTGLVHQWVPQTLRSWCNVPVARLPRDVTDAGPLLRQLAGKWEAEGRRLVVVSGAAETITATLPGVEPRATRIATNPHLLEQTLLSRPNSYVTQSIAL